MAKFIIAGKSDCPFYARAELLADQLVMQLPEFSVEKIVIEPQSWKKWLGKICLEKSWRYSGDSPLIWREFMNRGAKGQLIGSCDDFLEIANGYYGKKCMKTSNELKLIANENESTQKYLQSVEKSHEEKQFVCRVALINFDSGMSGSCVNFLPLLFNSINTSSEVILKIHTPLLELDTNNELNGIKMELEDCAFDTFGKVLISDDFKSAVNETDVIIVNTVKKALEEKEDIHRFKSFCEELNKAGSSKTKVYNVGEYALKSMFLINHFCDKICPENIYGLTRLEENRLKNAISKKLDVKSHQVSNVIVWGATENFIIDLSSAVVKGYNGAIWGPHIDTFTHSISKVLYDENWIKDELPQYLLIPEKNGISKAAAIISQLNDIMYPSSKGIFSLGCISKGWYGVPDGIPFSFPVVYENNEIEIKKDLQLNEELLEKIKVAAEFFAKECNDILQKM